MVEPLQMYALPPDDAAHVAGSFEKFKIVVALRDVESLCDEPILKELFEHMLDYALQYCETICAFSRIVKQTQESKDPVGDREAIEAVRGTKHDAFISSVKILSRSMARNKKDTTWYEKVSHSRAAFGLFALTLSFEHVKRARKEAA